MTKADIKADIIELERRHRNDRDGGHTLRAALTEYVKDLPADLVEDAVDVLLECVAQSEGTLPGAALWSLVDLGHPGTDHRIADLLAKADNEADAWKDQLVHSLIRLRTVAYRAFCVDYTRRAFTRKSVLAGYMIPALVLIDKAAFVDLAATYWIEILTGVRPCRDPATVMTTVLLNIAEADTSALTSLAEEIARRDRELKDKFVAVVRACLDKPWIESEWDPRIVEKLREAISKERVGD